MCVCVCVCVCLADLEFIRAEGFVFSHVADEGLMNACAGDLMRYRHNIGADNIMVFADVKKKHRYGIVFHILASIHLIPVGVAVCPVHQQAGKLPLYY